MSSRTPVKHEDGAGVPASARGASSSSVPPPQLPPPPAPPASDAAAAAGAAGAEVPPLPELSEARAAALLRGEIPVFEVALAEAYGAGVRALSRSGGGSGAAHEELRPAELVAILATPAGPLRLLATHMLASLARSVTALGSGPSDERAARGVLYAALDAGALPLLFVAAAEAAAAIEKDSAAAWGSRVGALHALSVTSELLSMLCSAAVLPPERACGVQTDAQLRTLAQACTASLRAAMALYQRKAPSEAEFAAAINLLSSFTFLELHNTMSEDLPDEAYRRDFSEGRFLYAGLCVLSAFPRTARAAAIGRVLHYGTNVSRALAHARAHAHTPHCTTYSARAPLTVLLFNPLSACARSMFSSARRWPRAWARRRPSTPSASSSTPSRARATTPRR
jgi:hypothetical protein